MLMLTARRSLAGGLALLATGVLVAAWGSGPDHSAVAAVDSGLAKGASAKSNCLEYSPRFIHDSFPQPGFISSKNGVMMTTLTAAMAPTQINGQTYVSSVYNHSYPGPTLVVCPGDRMNVTLKNELKATDFPAYLGADP